MPQRWARRRYATLLHGVKPSFKEGPWGEQLRQTHGHFRLSRVRGASAPFEYSNSTFGDENNSQFCELLVQPLGQPVDFKIESSRSTVRRFNVQRSLTHIFGRTRQHGGAADL